MHNSSFGSLVAITFGLCFAVALALGPILVHDTKLDNYPEHIHLSVGEIVSFEPYFDRCFSTIGMVGKRKYYRPEFVEGIDVTIAYSDSSGNTREFQEIWRIPCVDMFGVGDRLPIYWTNAWKKEPHSAVLAGGVLFASIELADRNEVAAKDGLYRQQQREQIESVLRENAMTYERLKKYKQIFFSHERHKWQWSHVEYARPNNNFESYVAAAQQRMEVIRGQIAPELVGKPLNLSPREMYPEVSRPSIRDLYGMSKKNSSGNGK